MMAGIRASLPPEATVRLQFAAAEAAQVDFGAGPVLVDPARGEPRRTWAFVMKWARPHFITRSLTLYVSFSSEITQNKPISLAPTPHNFSSILFMSWLSRESCHVRRVVHSPSFH
jgi:hypothetical protein